MECIEMESNKVLSALSYMSVLFAPFLVPIIIYFVTVDTGVKKHAKRAFLSHLIPLIGVPLVIGALFFDLSSETEIPFLFLGAAVLTGLISLIVGIWNIVIGIKILVKQ
jgi:hypothetical protein